MTALVKLFHWMTLRDPQPEVALAQYRDLRNQIPLLYALISVNSVAGAYLHFDDAPVWLTVWTPTVLVLVSLVRLCVWLRKSTRMVDGQEAIRLVRRTAALCVLFAAAYIGWTLAASRYVEASQQSEIAIFCIIAVMASIVCLKHLPQAMLAVAAIVTVPFLVEYILLRETMYQAIGLNLLLVLMTVIGVLLNDHRSFVRLVRAEAETRRLNREVTVLAHRDQVTRLPNRHFFFDELNRRVERLSGLPGEIAVGVIDLDRFKSINDTYGHLFGDQLLAAVGVRLLEVFGPARVVARIGGDEFAFWVDMDPEAATNLANRACEALAEPFRLGDISISIGASCGLSTFVDLTDGAMSLYEKADYALYSAKRERRGFAVLYSAEHEIRIGSERAVEAALQAADLDSEMDVHLQPIVNGPDADLIAVEALARWTSPSLGAVRPDVFIPLAERAGIIHRLTLTLLRKSLVHLQRLPPDLRLSFNLSAHDLICPETVLGIVSIVRQSRIDPSRIAIELTETAVMRDFDAAEKSIRLLRNLGILIALDDFGTGHSSLSYLHRLPIDRVKIDRSFVAGMETETGRRLLGAIVALCVSLKLQCVAEGVENMRQFETLRELGCNKFQGYLFGKPMAIDDLLDWIADAAPRDLGKSRRSATP